MMINNNDAEAVSWLKCLQQSTRYPDLLDSSNRDSDTTSTSSNATTVSTQESEAENGYVEYNTGTITE
jgi:hypothetical protein